MVYQRYYKQPSLKMGWNGRNSNENKLAEIIVCHIEGVKDISSFLLLKRCATFSAGRVLRSRIRNETLNAPLSSGSDNFRNSFIPILFY